MMSVKPVGFWGLVVEPDRMYSQVVPVSFKVTMAALGPVSATSSNGATGSATSPSKSTRVASQQRSVLMLTHQKDGEFALCSLVPEGQPNQTLDLVFLEGETIHFRVIGEQAIHLTGYYFEDADESVDTPYGGGYDSEELEAELNGESIGDTDSESGKEEDEEADEEEDDEEVDSDMADFINDEELEEDEASDSDTVTETEGEESETEKSSKLKKILGRKPKSQPRIRELVSDEENDDDEEDEEEYDQHSGDNFEVLSVSVSEDSQFEPSDKESNEDEDEEETSEEDEEETSEEDEEVDSDEAGSVDMSPGKKTAAKKMSRQPEPSKRIRVEAKPSQDGKKSTVASMISPAASSPAAGSPAKGNPSSGKNKILPSGLQIEDIKLGAGIKAQKGRRVTISYTMLANGKPASGSSTLQFNLGDADIAKGIAIGIQGMALGGERRLVVPATMIDEKSKPALSKAGNCVLHVKLDAVQPAPKSK